MTRWRAPHMTLGLALAAALGLAACGGGGEDGGQGASGTGQELPPGAYDPFQDPAAGRKGGVITINAASDVDHMDPAQAYYQFSYMVLDATQRRLYATEVNDPKKQIPDLADGMPEVSDDQRTVTVKLRKGVRYAPPVDREVTSRDVKYAVERAFAKGVANQYTSYFDFIEGAPREPTAKVPDISGIRTPDDQTIEFTLEEPRSAELVASLVLPYTAPVPESYARRYDARRPTGYETQTAQTGPYMVKADPRGRLVGWKRTKSIELVRNPNWDAETDFRPAYVDGYRIKTDVSDTNVGARQVLAGKRMLLDGNPSPQTLKRLVTRTKDQYSLVPGGGWRYQTLNTTIKPFDDVNVRRAILASFDRDALRKARGGRFVGPIPRQYIPPAFPGYEESGGAKGFGFDFMNSESGNPQLARKYMRKAGYRTGRYDGDETFLLVTGNDELGKGQGSVARRELAKLGFKVRVRAVPQDAVYTDWCQQPRKKVAICGSPGWFKDFNDPTTLFSVTFDGTTIARDGGNNNLSELDDDRLNALIAKAQSATGEERTRAWTAVNRRVVSLAPAVLFVHDVQTTVRSRDVVGVPNAFNSLWDLSYTSVRR